MEWHRGRNISRVLLARDMMPNSSWKELLNEAHTVADEFPPTRWVRTNPSEGNGRIRPEVYRRGFRKLEALTSFGG